MSEEERLAIAKERIEYILKKYNVYVDCIEDVDQYGVYADGVKIVCSENRSKYVEITNV